jgi:hypothetical protein
MESERANIIVRVMGCPPIPIILTRIALTTETTYLNNRGISHLKAIKDDPFS